MNENEQRLFAEARAISQDPRFQAFTQHPEVKHVMTVFNRKVNTLEQYQKSNQGENKK